MYLEITEMNKDAGEMETVGEVHVNPYSYTYDGSVDSVEEQLKKWDEQGGYKTVGGYYEETDEGPVFGQTIDVGDEHKLNEISTLLSTVTVNPILHE